MRNDEPPLKLPEHDLELGAKANRVLQMMCVVVFIVCLGIAVFVVSTVPLDTRLSYSGRFGRSGIPMPFAMAVVPLVVFFTWRATRKPDAHHMGKGDRMVAYWIGVPMVLAFLYGHWILAESMLVDVGVLAG